MLVNFFGGSSCSLRFFSKVLKNVQPPRTRHSWSDYQNRRKYRFLQFSRYFADRRWKLRMVPHFQRRHRSTAFLPAFYTSIRSTLIFNNFYDKRQNEGSYVFQRENVPKPIFRRICTDKRNFLSSPNSPKEKTPDPYLCPQSLNYPTSEIKAKPTPNSFTFVPLGTFFLLFGGLGTSGVRVTFLFRRPSLLHFSEINHFSRRLIPIVGWNWYVRAIFSYRNSP